MVYIIIEAFTAVACTEVFLGNQLYDNGVNNQCFEGCLCFQHHSLCDERRNCPLYLCLGLHPT
jgi:hypothetical protein